MGPSGAGKSTFVKVLANIYKAEKNDMIFCNDQPLTPNFNVFKKYFSYVAQEDVLFDNLTVYENLFHYGKLKNPTLSSQMLNKKIDEILIKTNLITKKNQIIGTPDGMILSGGERRRLNIALELIADTDIMILDEPTSGLSSYDSENIINLLYDLSKLGKIIYVVIHQPSREIYLKFTHLILLDRGGCLAYFGSTRDSFFYFSKYASNGRYPKNADDIFSILEEVKKTPDGKVIYEESSSKHRVPLRVRTPAQWESIFAEYQKSKRKTNRFEEKLELPSKQKLTIKDKITQFNHLLFRNLENKFHGQRFLMISILMPLCLAFVALFLRDFSPNYSFYGNTQIPKYLFLSSIILIFLSVSASINEILNERYIIRKERMIGYSVTSYYINKLISQAIVSIYQVAIYLIVSFFILKIPILSNIKFFLLFYLLSVVASVSVSSIALMLSSIIKTEKQAFMVIPIFIIPQIVFGGMFINYNDINFKFSKARPVPEICDLMHARWMFEGYTALMQSYDVVNKGVNDFTVDYNIITLDDSAKTKKATVASVVFSRRLELMKDIKTNKSYYKKNKMYAKRNVNIFPSTVKLFYSNVLSTYLYNILIMVLFALVCSVFTVIRIYNEK
jgi:ABC-type multidrug transport system ATPase subunit